MTENKQKEGEPSDFFRPIYSIDFGKDDCKIHVRYKDEIENCLRDSRTTYIAEPVEIDKGYKGLEGILNKKYINKKDYRLSEDVGYIQQAEAIHRARLDEYSQEEIAAYLGVSASTIREREKEFFDLDDVRKAKQEKYVEESKKAHSLREEGLTYKAVGERLGISESAARRREKLYSKISEREAGYLVENVICDKEITIGDLSVEDYPNIEHVFDKTSTDNPLLYGFFGNIISGTDVRVSRNTSLLDNDDFDESVERALSRKESFLEKIRRFFLNEEIDAQSYEHAKIDLGLVAAGILNRLGKGISRSRIINEYINREYIVVGEPCRVTYQEIDDIYDLQKMIKRKRIKGWQGLEKEFINCGTHKKRMSFLDDLENKIFEEETATIEKPTLVDTPRNNLMDKVFRGVTYAALILIIVGSFLRIKNSLKKSALHYEEKPEEIHLRLTNNEIGELKKDPYENERFALREWAMRQQHERMFAKIDRVKEVVSCSFSFAAEFGDYFLKS